MLILFEKLGQDLPETSDSNFNDLVRSTECGPEEVESLDNY